MVQELGQIGQPRTLDRRSPSLPRPARRRWFAQAGIEAQTGDHRHVRREVAQQGDGREAAVGHRNNAPARQPAGNLQQRLPAPVRELLVWLALIGGIPLGGRQHGQEGQAPDTPSPGHGRQQHDTQPTQSAGLHKVPPARADRIPVDPFCGDARTAPAFDGVVEPDHHRAGRHEGGNQQQQEPMRQGP